MIVRLHRSLCPDRSACSMTAMWASEMHEVHETHAAGRALQNPRRR